MGVCVGYCKGEIDLGRKNVGGLCVAIFYGRSNQGGYRGFKRGKKKMFRQIF